MKVDENCTLDVGLERHLERLGLRKVLSVADQMLLQSGHQVDLDEEAVAAAAAQIGRARSDPLLLVVLSLPLARPAAPIVHQVRHLVRVLGPAHRMTSLDGPIGRPVLALVLCRSLLEASPGRQQLAPLVDVALGLLRLAQAVGALQALAASRLGDQ